MAEVEMAEVEKAEVEMAEVEKADDKDDTGIVVAAPLSTLSLSRLSNLILQHQRLRSRSCDLSRSSPAKFLSRTLVFSSLSSPAPLFISLVSSQGLIKFLKNEELNLEV
ncbi:hypothetical protein LWI29_005341 [Acer saccharum]|uniref:Uncharacterized protein n=1 Tax=Acer saccharum TaxID=4024 RepID=A0AA39RC88_ACESA|nr:hypothetical protein LWI29_005341 [Acer saccharum]